MAGNKTTMIVRSSNTVHVQNSTSRECFKTSFILHSLIKHHHITLNQKHKGAKLFWGIFQLKGSNQFNEEKLSNQNRIAENTHFISMVDVNNLRNC